MNELSEKFFGLQKFASDNNLDFHFHRTKKGTFTLLLGMNPVFYGQDISEVTDRAWEHYFGGEPKKPFTPSFDIPVEMTKKFVDDVLDLL